MASSDEDDILGGLLDYGEDDDLLLPEEPPPTNLRKVEVAKHLIQPPPPSPKKVVKDDDEEQVPFPESPPRVPTSQRSPVVQEPNCASSPKAAHLPPLDVLEKKSPERKREESARERILNRQWSGGTAAKPAAPTQPQGWRIPRRNEIAERCQQENGVNGKVSEAPEKTQEKLLPKPSEKMDDGCVPGLSVKTHAPKTVLQMRTETEKKESHGQVEGKGKKTSSEETRERKRKMSGSKQKVAVDEMDSPFIKKKAPPTKVPAPLSSSNKIISCPDLIGPPLAPGDKITSEVPAASPLRHMESPSSESVPPTCPPEGKAQKPMEFAGPVCPPKKNKNQASAATPPPKKKKKKISSETPVQQRPKRQITPKTEVAPPATPHRKERKQYEKKKIEEETPPEDDAVDLGNLDAELEEDEFLVEQIVDRRTREVIVNGKTKRITEWLVKWLGYPSEENTWEPKENLATCPVLLDEFNKNFKKRTKEKTITPKGANTPDPSPAANKSLGGSGQKGRGRPRKTPPAPFKEEPQPGPSWKTPNGKPRTVTRRRTCTAGTLTLEVNEEIDALLAVAKQELRERQLYGKQFRRVLGPNEQPWAILGSTQADRTLMHLVRLKPDPKVSLEDLKDQDPYENANDDNTVIVMAKTANEAFPLMVLDYYEAQVVPVNNAKGTEELHQAIARAQLLENGRKGKVCVDGRQLFKDMMGENQKDGDCPEPVPLNRVCVGDRPDDGEALDLFGLPEIYDKSSSDEGEDSSTSSDDDQ